MPNPVKETIDLDGATGNVAGHIACVTNAGFTQRAEVTVTDSKGDAVAQGTFEGNGEKNTPTPLEGGGTVLSFQDAALPLTLNVSLSYNPGGTFQPNSPDKVIVNQLFNNTLSEAYQVTSEDWVDGDFNDLIMTAVFLKHS